MIPQEPDLEAIEELQKEARLLHQSRLVERMYHWEEQSRAFSLVPMLRAAMRDIDRPLSVLKKCQRTSLKWWKCRKTARQLHDYLHDMVYFLDEQMNGFREVSHQVRNYAD